MILEINKIYKSKAYKYKMSKIYKITKEMAIKFIKNNRPSQEHRSKFKLQENDFDMADYYYQEKVLREIFNKYPQNINVKIVQFKCRMLDKYYSTNLKEALNLNLQNNIIDKILNSNFDKEVNNVDCVVNLVNKIKQTNSSLYDSKNVLSFASKYCSMHNSKIYPIYDKYVRQMLYFINKYHNFTQIQFTITKNSKNTIYDNYELYKQIIDEFNKFFFEGKLNYKEIDIYLWLWAKDILRKYE